MKTPSELVRACFTAWETSDRDAIEELMADDFTFTSPKDDHLSREQYWVECWANSDMIHSYKILNLVEEGSTAFVRYVAKLQDGKRFINTEFFSIENGKIASVEVYFGRELS